MDRSETPQGWWLHPAALAAMFVVALSALLPDHLLFHPDERHYVDAGLQMVESGDWVTPRSTMGEPRLRKPVLPYWFVALGCQIFGPSPFSSRLMFVLAGGGVVWLSWLAARQATASNRAAVLTALIVMCHPALILSSSRSLPDIVLCLFLTMSLAGFLGIVAGGRPEPRLLALAYGGGALAVLSKGAPAAVFVLYSTIFLLVKQRSMVLVHWKRFTVVGLIFLALSGSWFLAMQVMHGHVLGDQFLNDQAGSERIADHPAQVLKQGLISVLVLAASFAPALLSSLPTLTLRGRDALAILDRPVSHFLLGWCLLFLSAAACVNHVSLRYLLPLVAPLGVMLGYVLAELEGPLLRRSLRWLAWTSIALLLPFAGLAFAVMNSDHPLLTIAALLALTGCGVLLVRQMRFTSAVRSVAVSAMAMQIALGIAAWGGQTLQGRSFGYEIAELLHSRQTTGPLVLIGEAAHASRIRICSGGDVGIVAATPATASSHSGAAMAALDPAQLPPESAGVTHVRVACGYHNIEPKALWTAIKDGRLVSLLQEHRREYTVAIPVPRDPHAVEIREASNSEATPGRTVR